MYVFYCDYFPVASFFSSTSPVFLANTIVHSRQIRQPSSHMCLDSHSLFLCSVEVLKSKENRREN